MGQFKKTPCLSERDWHLAWNLITLPVGTIKSDSLERIIKLCRPVNGHISNQTFYLSFDCRSNNLKKCSMIKTNKFRVLFCANIYIHDRFLVNGCRVLKCQRKTCNSRVIVSMDGRRVKRLVGPHSNHQLKIKTKSKGKKPETKPALQEDPKNKRELILRLARKKKQAKKSDKKSYAAEKLRISILKKQFVRSLIRKN